MAVVPIKISWHVTVPLAYEPKGRGLVRWMRHPPPPASGKDQEDGLKGSSLIDAHPHPACLQGFAPSSSPICAFSSS